MKAFTLKPNIAFSLTASIITLVCLISSGFAAHLFGQKVSYTYPETIRLVALVDDAALAISQPESERFFLPVRNGFQGIPLSSLSRSLRMRNI